MDGSVIMFTPGVEGDSVMLSSAGARGDMLMLLCMVWEGAW